MSYKVLKQTDKFFQIKHPDGSTFTVPKKGLSEAMLEKIRTMDGYAEGGMVQPTPGPTPPPVLSNAPGSPEYEAKLKKGFHSREPQYWLTKQGLEEEAALLEPSIMDKYIQETDPEQYGRMLAAHVNDYAKKIGPMVGSTKIPGLKGTAAMPEVLPKVEPSIPAVVKPQQAIGLPMDEASRMARAREMGFNPDETWYHGTKANIEEFAPTELGSSTGASSAKKGFFFTKDASTAGDYATLAPLQYQKTFNRAMIEHAPDVQAIRDRVEKYIYDYLKQNKGEQYSYLEDLKRLKIKKQNWDSQLTANPENKQAQEAASRLELTINRHKKNYDLSGLSKSEFETFDKMTDEMLEANKSLAEINAASKMAEQQTIEKINKDPRVLKLQEQLEKAISKKGSLQGKIGKSQQFEIAAAKVDEIWHKKQDLIDSLSKEQKQIGNVVYPTHLKMKNPYIHDFYGAPYRDVSYASILERAKKAGHDSVILKNTFDPANSENRKLIDVGVVFEPHQIRSKFAEFDPSKAASGKISYAHGGKVGDKNMSYRIIKDAEDHYQVLHPDGSRFTVPKKGISKEMHEKIAGMPKLFDGDTEMPEDRPLAMDESLGFNRRDPNYGLMAGAPPVRESFPSPVLSPEETAPIEEASTMPESSGLQYKPSFGAYENRNMGLMPETDYSKEFRAPQSLEEAPAVPAPAPSPVFSAKGPYGAQLAGMQQRVSAVDERIKSEELAAKKEMNAQMAEADQRQKDMNDYINKADDEAQKLFEQTKIDPSRYWSSMSTGNKILAGLSVALGGIGAGLQGPGAKNYALEIINKAIDADIDAQKENRNSAYSTLLNKHKRHETALAAAKADALQKVQNQINQFAMTTKSAEVQQSAAKLINDIELQKITLQDAYKKKAAGEYLTNQAAKGANMTPQEIELLPDEARKRFINGIGLASDDKAATKIREVKANADDITSIIKRLRKIRSEVGVEYTPSQASTIAKSLGQILIGKLREPVLGPGTMQQSEYERLQSVIPADVTEVASFGDNMFAKLDTLQDIIDSNLDNKIRAEGIIPKVRPSRTEGVALPQQGLMLNK